jgi:RND family efflux transporter MFP subunit
MKVSRRTAVLALAAVVLALIAALHALSPPEVAVAGVRRGDLEDVLSAPGVVEALQATVAPRMIGRVEALLVDEGDHVEAGDLLARLESAEQRAALMEREAALRVANHQVARSTVALEQERAASRARIARAGAAEEAARARLQALRAGERRQEIESARQAVAAAEAEAELSASNAERIDELLTEGAVSRAEADAARARLAAARASLRTAREHLALIEEGARAEEIEAAEADLAAAEAGAAEAEAAAGGVAVLERTLEAARSGVEQARAAVAIAASQLAETQVVAPISGWIGRRYRDVGDLAAPQSPLFLISDSDNVWVTAEVDEEDLALVREGQAVEVDAEALPQPVAGQIVEIGPVAVPRGLQQTRAKIVRCRIVLKEEAEVLRPGMEVDVSARAMLAEDTLLAPSEAVMNADGESFALVVEGGVAGRRGVEVGRRTYREVEIRSGVREGDEVVVSGGSDLPDNSRVKVKRD